MDFEFNQVFEAQEMEIQVVINSEGTYTGTVIDFELNTRFTTTQETLGLAIRRCIEFVDPIYND